MSFSNDNKPSNSNGNKPSNDDKKRLRGIGHRLTPVVTIAANGLSAAVLAEIERALADHELIKIKLALPDRMAKQVLLTSLCGATKAQLVQAIGHTALLLRRSDKPNPKLSNLTR
ncbi:MAG: YhbY family RNA-binding protein [Porticoccaceae bacterium]